MADISDSTPGGDSAVSTAAPTAIELKEDSMVRLPGAKEPVRWGDHQRNFQSEYTRKAQTAAQYEREKAQWATERSRYEAALRRNQSQNQPQPEDPLAGIADRTYLDGKSAYDMVKALRAEYGGYKGEFGKRDQALQMIVQHLQNQEQQLQQLRGHRSDEEFTGKIGKWTKDLDLDEGWQDIAKEVYLAYEGPDLDNEFPSLLKKRVDQIQSLTRAMDKRRSESARRLPFTPTKGGNGAASKPASIAGKSNREIAEEFWNAVGKDGEGT